MKLPCDYRFRALPLILLLATTACGQAGLSGTAADELAELQQPTKLDGPTELAEAGLTAVDLNIPDVDGNMHSATAIVSDDLAAEVGELFATAEAILAAPGETRPLTPSEQREDTVSALAAARADGAAALAALVFEDEEVIGWKARLVDVNQLRRPEFGANQPLRVTINSIPMTTTAALQQKHSGSYYCSSGASANGSRSTSSTTNANMRFYWSAPWPNGSQIQSTILVSSGSPNYVFVRSYVGSWYYVTQTQINAAGTVGTTGLLFCY